MNCLQSTSPDNRQTERKLRFYELAAQLYDRTVWHRFSVPVPACAQCYHYLCFQYFWRKYHYAAAFLRAVVLDHLSDAFTEYCRAQQGKSDFPERLALGHGSHYRFPRMGQNRKQPRPGPEDPYIFPLSQLSPDGAGTPQQGKGSDYLPKV